MLTPALAIRRLGVADTAAFRALRLEALEDAPDAFGSTYDAEAAQPIAEHKERLASSTVLGAHVEGELVGIVGYKAESGRKNAHKAFVWGMYVRAAARRQGIGAALVDTLLRSAKSSVEQLTLTVVRGNDAAFGLFEGAGFTTFGVQPRSLKTPSGYLDEILMRRLLD